jgi:hypothetical protein
MFGRADVSDPAEVEAAMKVVNAAVRVPKMPSAPVL